MKNCNEEVQARVAYIRAKLNESGARGIVVGNSGGKDCALTLLLCKQATDNVLSVIMPCHSKRNYGMDKRDAEALCNKFGIENVVVDISDARTALTDAISPAQTVEGLALANIAPRLRMATLYAIAQGRGYLVAGTGNSCEAYMGYFTKWGDGAHDFNAIADLKVSEIYELLRYLGAPDEIIDKAPSAALFEGQTDENEMGVKYSEIEAYLNGEPVSDEARAIIERMHRASEHKRKPISCYGDK